MRHKTHQIRARLDKGEDAVGIWVQTGGAAVVEIAGAVGLDFVLIDGEHGPFGFDHVVSLIRAAQAAGVMPVVRVPVTGPGGLSELGRYLDAGATGLLVPQVGSASHASAIVAATKYRTGAFPDGARGACPITRATAYSSPDWASYADRSNDGILVWLLLESPEAMDDLPAIVEVPGVDGIMFGTHDLSVAMGCNGDRTHPDVLAKLDGAVERVRRKGIEVIGSLDDASPAAAVAHHARLAADGSRIFLTASDGRVLFNSFHNLHEALRQVARMR
ncbi:HpcH/HpaI aldolase family protein [Sphingobium sp.]|uniref:HpcH/HpaI aldolase family protein n=1 Tax=Sphingobium sp. TaxID=1912891 RepID=UPI002C76702B|nr:aldolase/citrate lyase family protein [Sphingobium sp.]HUD90697.1 aldolase/citrate lyase family protein [Sphingobium sp.]